MLFIGITPSSAEEMPERIVEAIVVGDIESLESYVEEGGSFADKTVEDANFGGQVNVAYVLSYLPFVGDPGDQFMGYLEDADDEKVARLRDRNRQVASVVFENGGDPNAHPPGDLEFFTVPAAMLINLAELEDVDGTILDRVEVLMIDLLYVMVEYGSDLSSPAVSLFGLAFSSVHHMDDLFDALLEMGADPTAEIMGMSVTGGLLTASFEAGSIDTGDLETILSYEGAVESIVNNENPSGVSYLAIAVAFGIDSLVREMIELGQDVGGVQVSRDGYGAAHMAAASGYPAILETLIDSGAPFGAVTPGGPTALHVVGEENTERIVRILLKAGADVEAVDTYGWTPLMHAAYGRNTDAFELLLERGADPFALDGNGQSVLCHAAAGGDEDIVETLIDLGVDIDSGGPLVQAAYFGQLEAADLLLRNGADPDVEAAVFSKRGDRFEFLGSYTPRRAAEKENDHQMIRLLEASENGQQ